MALDWYRLAKPQDDDYDMNALFELEFKRKQWQKYVAKTPYTLAHGGIAVYPGANPNAGAHISLGPNTEPCDLSDITLEWIQTINPFVDTWTRGVYGLGRFVDEFWTWKTVRGNPKMDRYPFAPNSGHKGCLNLPYHVLYATIDNLVEGQSVPNPHGVAQGLYHEYGHMRLFAMGIEIETHNDRLLLNGPDELYKSPVRYDKLRPMSAVLHGLYAWLMFTENDYQLYQAGVITPSHNLTPVEELYRCTAHNIPKIKAGVAEVKQFGRFTSEGQDFVRGIYDWADDLVARCTQALAS